MQLFEIGGGRVETGATQRLSTPPNPTGYVNAQLDDYHGAPRRLYPHRASMIVALRARFSHGVGVLKGTAGFGFWNAPFGDPTAPWPMLPSATWFFYASEPNRLPFLRGQTGWFASTIDARWGQSALLLPTVVPVVLGNQIRPIFNKIWPPIERWLGISAEAVPVPMTEWHDYRLEWHETGSRFFVDDVMIHQTSASPRRPLGFVCWIDNQYMVATPRGRFGAGMVRTEQAQWMEIDGLRFGQSTT